MKTCMLDLRAQPRDRVLIDNADHTLGKRVADFRSEAARDKARAVRNAGMGPSGLDFHALRGHGYQLGVALACHGPAPARGDRADDDDGF